MQPFSMKDLGLKIKSARKLRGVSQEYLANIIGVTKSTISKYELGLREPGFEQLFRIADALNLHPFDVMPSCMQEAFFAGYNKTMHTDRYLDAINNGDEFEAEAAELDAINLNYYFNQLNKLGQQEAVKILEELTKTPKYKNNPPQD